MPVQRPSTRSYRTALYDDAVTIVESEFASDLSLDDVARRIATSRRQLQRSFSEIGGSSFRDHVTHIRMDRAAALLADPKLTVGQVSRMVGYRQQAQFAKAFRRRHGAAPAEYRRLSPSRLDDAAAPDRAPPDDPARPSDG